MQETELILHCQIGDRQAFHELITLYYPYVTKFLLQLTQDALLSEDLTQDTFIRLIRSIDKFDLEGKASFSTYVLTIAKNLYIDHLRKTKHAAFEELDLEFPSEINVEANVMSQMAYQSAQAALKTLPPEQADAIRMKYLEQLTLAEIADKLGCEPKTIKSRIHNGIVRLRRKLIM